jgi:uncharacterized protein (TIGR03435 family)
VRITLFITLLSGFQVFGQPPSQRPSFEVADIRPSDQARTLELKERILPSGRVELPGETIVSLMMFAYSVREGMIENLPKWGGNQHFDIIAKAPPNTSVASLRLMVQSLLAERFKLAFHTEAKSRSVFVLCGRKRWAEASQGFGRQTSMPLEEGGTRRDAPRMPEPYHDGICYTATEIPSRD